MSIEDWRAEIDEVDNQLLRLLNTRARLAAKIGHVKREVGLPLSDEERERHVVQRMQSMNAGPLDESAVMKLFECIIRESRRVESAVVAVDQAGTENFG
jgi:chorismate mutase